MLKANEDATPGLAWQRAERPSRGPAVQLTLLGWCGWLLGSWALVQGPVVPPMVFERWMSYAAVFGLMAAWPAARLSQHRGLIDDEHGRLRPWLVLLDVAIEWVCMVLVLQVVLWSMALTAGWGFEQAMFLNLAVIGWSGLSAWVVACGAMSRQGAVRALAMSGCIVLLIGGPVAAAASGARGGPVAALLALSPWPMLWGLSGEARLFVGELWQMPLMRLYAVAGAAWIGLGVLATLLPRGRDAGERGTVVH